MNEGPQIVVGSVTGPRSAGGQLQGTSSPSPSHPLTLPPQGQYCDICTARNSNKAHPASNAIDGTERWWQSPPLSRGLQYNEVNVTLDLGQVQSLFCPPKPPPLHFCPRAPLGARTGRRGPHGASSGLGVGTDSAGVRPGTSPVFFPHLWGVQGEWVLTSGSAGR